MNQSATIIFDDHLYPVQPLSHTRHTVRVLIKDQTNNYLFLRIKGKDDFGERNHLESVGGGVEPGESLEDAVTREVQEETGYRIRSNITPLCVIEDCYYLIQRKTISHFFIVSVNQEDQGTSHPTVEETKLFHSLVWIPEHQVEEALNITKQLGSIGELIHRRDLFAFQYYQKLK